MKKPEIMSPAGHWPQLRAAIDAGADAVYFGLDRFTARAKVGFTLDELPRVMDTLHEAGARGYVTFNTLVFDEELDEAARLLTAIARAGADAVIVQDLGAARTARDIAPDLEVHGSTQMSITSAEGVEFARRFGVTRVVLARELSLAEIRAIRGETAVELEMFVHGALCVSYSGQCFSSEAWGGRSANRGQCAQACRLPYEMVVDGVARPLGDARYPLSPGDLYTLRQIPEIVDAGVSCLKIEGRYKDADYVSATTAAYRRAVDAACAGQAAMPDRAEELRLEQLYSRGLGPWFVNGVDHQSVVRGRAPRHRGVWVGTVERVLGDGVALAFTEAHADAPLKPGDGVVFDAADWRSPQEREEGGRVFEVDGATVRFGNGAVDFGRIRMGDLVWRTDDPAVAKSLRAEERWLRPVRFRVTAVEGEPLSAGLWVAGRPDTRVTVRAAQALTAARARPLDLDTLRAQLGRLGDTPFALEEVEADIQGRPFAPVSVLNELRREAVTALQERLRRVRHTTHAWRAPSIRSAPRTDAAPSLHLLVRTPEQLEAALDARPASITLDYLDLHGLRPSVERVRAVGIEARVASPRVLKPGEERIVRFLRSLDCGVLARGAGLLHQLLQDTHPPLHGDFSLNATNALTASALLDLGLVRLTPGHDCNGAQVTRLARAVGPGVIEVVAYHHMPVFHTEHCVFCRFLSTGKSYKDCGRPCEKHRVELRDEQGRAHPVMADTGCRNTVFGAEAQEASAHLDGWIAAGIRNFRLEFAHETAAETAAITEAFRARLGGQRTSRQLHAALREVAPGGVTEGSLFVVLA